LFLYQVLGRHLHLFLEMQTGVRVRAGQVVSEMRRAVTLVREARTE
jgi:hypothetical protein